MNKAFGNDDAALARYIFELYDPEDEQLREIRERASGAGLPGIQVAALDARHLEVLVRMTGVRKAVEIGTLAGYSAVSIVRGMLDGGVLYTLEADPHHADVAAESFRRVGISDRVRQLRGPALSLLPALAAEGPFDFCFIDADKESYDQYLDWAAANLRPGGVVAGDNAFLFGALHSNDPRPSAGQKAMRAFHRRLATSGEFRATALPTGEGLAIGVRL
jgi:predicted O-methyltransferase YrrM